MNDAIQNMLPFALGVAISPIPIVAVVLLLTSRRGGINGIAYLIGGALGIALIGCALIFSPGGFFVLVPKDSTEENTTELVFGVLLLLGALRSFMKWWKSRSLDGEPALPKWMERLHELTPLKAGALALGLAFVNIKNLLLTLAGMTEIATATQEQSDQLIALALFTAIGIAGPAIPVAIYYSGGEQAPAKLARLRTWLVSHNHAVLAIILLAIGLKLLYDGVT